jgi:hypothetical protein
MANKCRATVVLALLTISFLGVGEGARADVISSGGFSVGIFRAPTVSTPPTLTPGAVYGTLNDIPSSTGFSRPDGFDPYGLTSQRDAYGVSAGPFNGYADPNNTLINRPSSGGVFNIAPGFATFTANSASVRTFLTSNTGTQVLQIDQNFSFLPGNNNVLKDTITLTNITAAAGIPQDLPVQFRRVTEWSMSNPNNANTIDTVDPIRAFVTGATPRSFGPNSVTESPNPATGQFVFNAPGGGVFGAPQGGDFGAGINLDLGTLLAFDNPLTPQDERVASFNYFYAVGQTDETDAQLRAQLNALGINYLITGRNGTRDAGFFDGLGPLSAAVGVQISVVIPEPATIALFGLGLAGLAGWRLRRKSPA